MYKIAMVDYFATGEGHTFIVSTGSEAKIFQEIPKFLQQGMTSLTPDEWLEEEKKGADSSIHSDVEQIKKFAPTLWSCIARNPKVFCDFSLHYHLNLS
ncbi:hypothetical protein L4D21_05500 [Photobacterium profundum]|uniref:hypothetical protein n=1 Tax=Photobacterium profundum TaxID=74109 RepID=UPI003D1303A8